MSKKITTYEDQMERDMLQAMEKKGWHYAPKGLRKTVSLRMPQVKAYKSGEIDRLTASFRTSSFTADEHLRLTLRNMRARSRQLCMNDPYAKRFLSLLVTNVVGEQGIRLQNQAMQVDLSGKKDRNGRPIMVFDIGANEAIENAWEDWGTEGICDVTGEHSFIDLMGMIVRSVARDGEILVHKVYGREWNKYGFALQLIEADYLDEDHWRILPNGNRIIMGVEKNPWGRRVAYHILTQHPGELQQGYASQQLTPGVYSMNGRYYQRIPAEEIIHVGVSERSGQTRFVPWIYASMLRLNNLNGWEEAAIINARIGASKMGFYTSGVNSSDLDGSAVSTGKADDGTFLDEVEPGTFGKLPYGWDFKSFDPKYPDAEFKPFNSAMLHGITAGMDMSHSSITGDLTEVNFSSLRSGKVDERDVYKLLQALFTRKLLGPGEQKVFPSWIDTALMLGAIRLGNGSSLPYAKKDKFNAPKWQPRGFDWVDPKSDIEADTLAVNNGFMTRSEVCAKRGKDFRDVCAELSEEQRIAQEYGLDFTQGKTEAALKEKLRQQDNKQSAADKQAQDSANAQHREEMKAIARQTSDVVQLLASKESAPVINVSPPNITVNNPDVKVNISQENRANRVLKDGNGKVKAIMEFN